MRFFQNLLILILLNYNLYGQEVSILNYSINTTGQVQLQVASSQAYYYILNIRHNPTDTFNMSSSMTLGEAGTTLITEPLGSYPKEYYQILEYPITKPMDTDSDGIDDITEFRNSPTQSPLNNAQAIDILDGIVSINSLTTFRELSITQENIRFLEFLENKEYAKFIIADIKSDKPEIYFINSKTHKMHQDFAFKLGLDINVESTRKGEIIYHPNTISTNGTAGTFSFNFSASIGQPFEIVQKCHELLAANMPILKNNLSYFVTYKNELDYMRDIDLFQESRIPILLEADIYANTSYLALNVAEGFGYFRQMNLDEMPGPRDIVLYESLPNSLPRVGGIMTSIVQTPLSHVNLKAIQDKIPNAYIRNPMSIDSITSLIDHYVYFKVEHDKYILREATAAEVNAWFDDIRPDKKQNPALNLSYKAILPLDDINFDMSDGFGAKCTNLASLRTFDFPEETIPDGYGIPFYFYHEFMRDNGFFEDIAYMLANTDFQSNRGVRIEMLKDLRMRINEADMPQWIMNDLHAMQDAFPTGVSIRCRSSTNNEDLPNFSGAGLYTSKTQHPKEGHISKSIKQVYASMWNDRAYEEREFHRVNHFKASMGVLCHANYENEKVNGVGVSTDPIYQTDDNFYLNSQLGEDLVTNPDTSSFPEEILLDKVSKSENDYMVIRYSNLTPKDTLLMQEKFLAQMRDYLTVIHNEFAILYNETGNTKFAMDIEYKITSNNQLIIKQARPWNYFRIENDTIEPETNEAKVRYYPNPASNYLNVQCNDCTIAKIRITNLVGLPVLVETLDFNNNSTPQISIKELPQGVYLIHGYEENNKLISSEMFLKL